MAWSSSSSTTGCGSPHAGLPPAAPGLLRVPSHGVGRVPGMRGGRHACSPSHVPTRAAPLGAEHQRRSQRLGGHNLCWGGDPYPPQPWHQWSTGTDSSTERCMPQAMPQVMVPHCDPCLTMMAVSRALSSPSLPPSPSSGPPPGLSRTVLTPALAGLREDDCAICLESLQSSVGKGRRGLLTLGCKHVFHLRCAEAYVMDHARVTCPLCREVVCFRSQ